ncbi:MAG: toll/interleukin-1 receptor domain-containing protein [Bryobacteraceae bacterium]|nr:toll/interleukin-1 receptor domain-containing protein [Bryobacteraceae bacterium]
MAADQTRRPRSKVFTLANLPAPAERLAVEQVSSLVLECLLEGTAVEIDGLGQFLPLPNGAFEFVPNIQPRVFIAYVEEDVRSALRLYEDLHAAGFCPWIDKKKLLPGQNWPRAIERALDMASFVIFCFSKRALSKRGGFQSELRYALDCARELPPDRVYIIPARLEECAIPLYISKEIQWVDLFPNWDPGFRRIVNTMLEDQKQRQPAA